MRYRRKNGSTMWANVSVTYVPEDDEPFAIARRRRRERPHRHPRPLDPRGDPRRADRAAQPRALLGAARRCAARAACRAWRSPSSTSTTSRSSTTASVTSPATRCCARSRSACARSCGRARWSRGWAAMSSGSSSSTKTSRRASSGCTPPSPSRPTSKGAGCTRRPASASRSRTRATSTPKTCCVTPTSRCTVPRPTAARRTRSSTRRCTIARCAAADLLRRARRDQRRRISSASPSSRIVRLSDWRTVGYEALVRWNHPREGLLTPDTLHPGRRRDRGHRAARPRDSRPRACSGWRASKQLDAAITMHVNVSVQEIMHGDLARARLRRDQSQRRSAGDAHARDYRERNHRRQRPALPAVLERLRAGGVRICVDDFGIGYSSLRYLRQFPISSLKIDRSFVSGTDDGLASEPIVRMVLDLSRSLDLTVVAEGVETMEQAATAARSGLQLRSGLRVLATDHPAR